MSETDCNVAEAVAEYWSKIMNIGIAIVLLVVVVVVVILGYVISANNMLERQQVKVQEAFSGIDVALMKRYDTLIKLADTTRGFAKHERSVVLGVVQLRQGMPLADKFQAEQQMDAAAREINLLAESYPALTSQPVFVEQQRGVRDTEEHLQAARRLYNANVSTFNQLVVSFPSSIVASIKGMKSKLMYEAAPGKRSDVDLKM